MIGGVASKAQEAGLSFLIWREALSSEGPVGGASGAGVMDECVALLLIDGTGLCRQEGENKNQTASEASRLRLAAVVSQPPGTRGGGAEDRRGEDGGGAAGQLGQE